MGHHTQKSFQDQPQFLPDKGSHESIKRQRSQEEAKARADQLDVRFKRAELINGMLNAELAGLKARADILKSEKKSKSSGDDLLGSLDKFIDDDKSFIRPGHYIGGGGGEMMGHGASEQEYEFKIMLLEQDLQGVQSENNNLIQNVLKLKQEQREKKSKTDEVSNKLLAQEASELKREIMDIDNIGNKLVQEVESAKAKLSKMSQQNKKLSSAASDTLKDLKRNLMYADQSNQLLQMDIANSKTRLELKKGQHDIDKKKKEQEKHELHKSAEEEAKQVQALKSRLAVLTSRLSELQKQGQKQDEQELQKEHLVSLRDTNQRMMSEIMRLNEMIAKHKQEKGNMSMFSSLSISHIQSLNNPYPRNDLSLDASFINKLQ